MSFAVLLIPNFSLHAVVRSEPGLQGKPVALIEGEGRKAAVVQVSRDAEGVTPGLAVSLAMARCPALVFRPRDVQAEADARRLLLAFAFSLSPRVEVSGTEYCTVDLQGADALHTEMTLQRCIAELSRAGLPAKAGTGPTPLLALYAAQQAEPILIVNNVRNFLSGLPLAIADPTPEQTDVLHGWGIRTLGEFTRLSKAEIGRRLGTDGVALWERAAGEATRPLKLTPPSQSFAAAWDYEPGIENIEPLFFKLQRYAECLALELRSAGFVAESLALTFQLEDESDYRREYRLAEPGTDIESWLKVMHSQLESLTLPARVISVRFVAKPTRPLVKQDGLFDTGLRDPHAFWENIARVEALLGAGQIGTPACLNTWRPDAFAIERPAECVPVAGPPPVHPPRGGLLRRFRPPEQALVILENGRPSGISGYINGRFRDVAGPWRASGDWWHPDAWAIETWHVEMDSGALYQLSRTPTGWFIDGHLD
jgi:protein ImuB